MIFLVNQTLVLPLGTMRHLEEAHHESIEWFAWYVKSNPTFNLFFYGLTREQICLYVEKDFSAGLQLADTEAINNVTSGLRAGLEVSCSHSGEGVG